MSADGSDQKPTLARDTYRELADPRILATPALRDPDSLIRHFDLPLNVREPKLHLEPADWRTGFIKLSEREGFPPELFADLKELTPQANLRDLFRPVYNLMWHEREQRMELDLGGRRSLSEGRAGLSREPLPRVEPTVRAVVEEARRRRAWIAEPWRSSRPDEAPRTSFVDLAT